MRVFGLIGYPLGHSFSVGYFAKKFEKESIQNCEYHNFPLDNIDKLPALISSRPELVGLNVTIPYKQLVIPYLTELSADAKKIGAVNTIKIINNGSETSLKGFNTDVYGFQKSLEPHLMPFHKKALILGSGGAAKAVEFVLNNLNITHITVSRNPTIESQLSYNQLEEKLLSEHLLIINTTPVGMHPYVNSAPEIPYQFIGSQHIIFDLVYNPLETLFMTNAKVQGATVINGLKMLHLQAEKAWQIWNE